MKDRISLVGLNQKQSEIVGAIKQTSAMLGYDTTDHVLNSMHLFRAEPTENQQQLFPDPDDDDPDPHNENVYHHDPDDDDMDDPF